MEQHIKKSQKSETKSFSGVHGLNEKFRNYKLGKVWKFQDAKLNGFWVILKNTGGVASNAPA